MKFVLYFCAISTVFGKNGNGNIGNKRNKGNNGNNGNNGNEKTFTPSSHARSEVAPPTTGDTSAVPGSSDSSLDKTNWKQSSATREVSMELKKTKSSGNSNPVQNQGALSNTETPPTTIQGKTDTQLQEEEDLKKKAEDALKKPDEAKKAAEAEKASEAEETEKAAEETITDPEPNGSDTTYPPPQVAQEQQVAPQQTLQKQKPVKQQSVQQPQVQVQQQQTQPSTPPPPAPKQEEEEMKTLEVVDTIDQSSGSEKKDGEKVENVVKKEDPKADGSVIGSGGDSGKKQEYQVEPPKNDGKLANPDDGNKGNSNQESSTPTRLNAGAIVGIVFAIIGVLACVIYAVILSGKRDARKAVYSAELESEFIRHSINVTKKMADLEHGKVSPSMMEALAKESAEDEEESDEEESDEESDDEESESDDDDDEKSDDESNGKSLGQEYKNYTNIDSSQFATSLFDKGSQEFDSSQTFQSSAYSHGQYEDDQTSLKNSADFQTLGSEYYPLSDGSEGYKNAIPKDFYEPPVAPLESMAIERLKRENEQRYSMESVSTGFTSYGEDVQRYSMESVSTGFTSYVEDVMDYKFSEESLQCPQQPPVSISPPLPPRTITPPQPTSSPISDKKPAHERIASILLSAPKKSSPLRSAPSFLGPPKFYSDLEGSQNPLPSADVGGGYANNAARSDGIDSYYSIGEESEFDDDGNAFQGII